MPSTVITDELADARLFAESVAGAVERFELTPGGGWVPGASAADAAELSTRATTALEEIGWPAVAHDPALLACAGLGARELGRRLVSLAPLDALLGAAPAVDSLVRCRANDDQVLVRAPEGALVLTTFSEWTREPSADGLDVHRIGAPGAPRPVDDSAWSVALAAWRAAGVGYLAGLGTGALELTTDYVRHRRAFDATLAALAPVQQLLARAATAVRGVGLLAGDAPSAAALAHAGAAICDACACCQQVTGAIGYTLEHPLHRFTQRARGLHVWNQALLDVLGDID